MIMNKKMYYYLYLSVYCMRNRADNAMHSQIENKNTKNTKCSLIFPLRMSVE